MAVINIAKNAVIYTFKLNALKNMHKNHDIVFML